jgi:hypothetical protein
MDLDLVGRDKPKKQGSRSYFSVNPTLYVFILACVVFGTAAFKTASDSIFACDGEGYTSDRYLAYCHAGGYGDYEHGAFWFGLEPRASASATSADVLFLGDSRLEHAFSTTATADWFAAATARYYLLGFGYSENAVFAAGLLAALKPRAKLYVINIDRFFDRRETVPAKAVMEDGGAPFHYKTKRFWQVLHRPVCANLPAICGRQYVVFRSRATGTYYPSGASELEPKPVTYDQADASHVADGEVADARTFLAHLPVEHDCIILTLVPTVATKAAHAAEMAVDLGAEFVTPAADNLWTFDGSHLDHASAERWSAAFFRAAAPQIRRCLDRSPDLRS